MKKIVTKSSKQSRLEREKRRRDTSCPECGALCLGTVSTSTELSFLFKVTHKKKHNYTCIECNCEWTTGWEEE